MQAITRIDLLRHGEVEGGAGFRGSTDVALTDNGMQQMRHATAADCRWDRVITSPLQRCAVFAEEFAAQHSLPLNRDERIQEIHFGSWEGRSAADIMADTPQALSRFWEDPERHPPPKGEPLSLFQKRVLNAWQEIIQHCGGQRVLIVTHGGVIRLLLCHAQNRPLTDLLQINAEYGALHSLQVNVDHNQTHRIELIGQE